MSGIGENGEGKAVYARQIQAFGQSGDVMLVMSASGNAPDVVAAMEAASERDMRVVAVTGKGGGVMASLLSEDDVSICVPHDRNARIREVNSLIIHCLYCVGVGVTFFKVVPIFFYFSLRIKKNMYIFVSNLKYKQYERFFKRKT